MSKGNRVKGSRTHPNNVALDGAPKGKVAGDGN